MTTVTVALTSIGQQAAWLAQHGIALGDVVDRVTTAHRAAEQPRQARRVNAPTAGPGPSGPPDGRPPGGGPPGHPPPTGPKPPDK